MRARKFGLSEQYRLESAFDIFKKPVVYAYPATSMDPVASRPSREVALADYKKQRQNGRDSDNPKRSFPQDGTFDWVSEEDIAPYLKLPPRPGYYRRRYTQGPLDKAWMEERDRNYLTRRARKKAQQQQHAGAGASAAPSDAADDSAAASRHTATAPPADNSPSAAATPEPQTSPSSDNSASSPSP